MDAPVLFASPVARRGAGLTQNYQRLLKKAELAQIVKPGDVVAIKMHFGEPGNGRYIRPIFPVLLVDLLKELGAKPFVTDTPVLYKSLRNNAGDYYQVARRNGFTAETLGCPLLISGGMTDQGVKVTVESPLRLREIGISADIYQADVLISLTHVTLHLQYPLGAAVKNVGMGCVDITTKLALHDARGTTPRHLAVWEATLDGAKAVLSKFPGKFYTVNLLLDVTPDCDCFDKTDLPVVPDLGILAGVDPVAVDRASYDLVVAAPGYPGSKEEGTDGKLPGGDKIKPIYPRMEPDPYFEIAERAGIGSNRYRLIEI